VKQGARVWIILVLAAVGLLLIGGRLAVPWFVARYMNESADPEFFAADIAKFAAADREQPPPAHPIVFVGSSSIRLWNTLQQDMAPLPVLNRGFGGARLSSVVYFVDRVVIQYQPRAVVLYAGDNDLDAGESPDSVVRDFRRFVARVQAALPDVRIYYLSMKPNLRFWSNWPKYELANAQISALCAGDPRLGYIDGATPLFASGSMPPPELFRADQMHLSKKGYALWTAIVKSRLQRDLATAADPTGRH
jgi:lysophospholipase L1-like esterase